jgi:signal transduction histidine kinase
MPPLLRFLKTLILFFALASHLSASALVVGEAPLRVLELAPHAKFLVDPDGKLDIAEISSPPWSEKFQPASSSPPSFGFTRAAVWMRCEIRSQSPRAESLVFELHFPLISHVSWYLLADEMVEKSLAGGAAEKMRHGRNPAIEVQIPAGETRTLFARVTSDTSLLLPFVAGSPAAVERLESRNSVVDLLLIGFCGTAAAFIAMIGFTQRQSLFFYLAVFAALYACYYAIFHGYVGEIWPGRPFWIERTVFGITAALAVWAFIRFNGSYLGTRTMARHERFLQRSAEALLLVGAALLLVVDYGRAIPAVNRLIALGLLLATLVVILRVRHHRKREEAGFFLTWLAFAVCCTLITLKITKILPVSVSFQFLQQFTIPAVIAAFFLLAMGRQRSLQRLEIQLAETEALRSRAEQDRDAKSLFLANVSHEIRTPLSALVGLSQAMWLRCQSSAPDAEFTQFLNRVRSGGQYLGLLLRNVLNASAAESGRVPVRLREFYLSDWIDDVRNILAPLAEYHRGRIEWSLPGDDEARLRTDEMRLTQILLNLAENALKFGADSGKPVSICFEKTPRGLRITVEDHGPGIPDDRLDSIFSEFVQAGADASPAAAGVGLGLSVVKINTTLLGGTLAVERLPDAGMRFRVEIPDAPAAADAALPTPPAS